MEISLSAQLPIPSFDDLQKHLSFWLDQKDKWFYFEGEMLHIASHSETTNAPVNTSRTTPTQDETKEFHTYIQQRIVGKIHDIVSFPPSLLLQNATTYVAELNFKYQQAAFVSSKDTRVKYGLVFSQITYYEPIEDIEVFIKNDSRIRDIQKF